IAGEMSAPTTNPAGLTKEVATSAASPGPVATSSTRHPLVTLAAASTAGTKSRDQRPMYCPYAAASRGRPGAAWSPDPNLSSIRRHPGFVGTAFSWVKRLRHAAGSTIHSFRSYLKGGRDRLRLAGWALTRAPSRVCTRLERDGEHVSEGRTRSQGLRLQQNTH